jgi:hypothetical protein
MQVAISFEEGREETRMTFEEKIDETVHCRHDLACLYESSKCVPCGVASADGDNILFLKEKVPRFCSYRLSWGHSEICRCPTRYGISMFYPSWGQGKNPVGFWKADKNGLIINANRGMEGILGIAHDQIVGACVLTDFPRDASRRFLPFYDRAMNTGKTVRFENISLAPSSQRPSRQSGWLIPRFKDQELAHILCILKDDPDDYPEIVDV